MLCYQLHRLHGSIASKSGPTVRSNLQEFQHRTQFDILLYTAAPYALFVCCELCWADLLPVLLLVGPCAAQSAVSC
jgi:hypothetical protein